MIDSRTGLAAAALGALALVAACSSSGGGSGGSAQAGGSGMTVSVRNASSGQLLVNSSGRTLYMSDQEKAAGKVLCASSDCEAIWTPLTLPKGQQPTGPSSIAGMLGTERRPDGTLQVTFKGGPLYTFTFDHSAGDVNGNTSDSFNGRHFTWHAASANGAATAPTTGGSSPSYGGGGGYGY